MATDPATSGSGNVEKSDTVWTSDNIVVSPYKDIEIPNITISEYMWQNLEKWADKTAVICAITNRYFTYDQLHRYSLNLAANLRKKLNISDGDVIGIMMFNCPEHVLAFLGVLQSGAELMPVNPYFNVDELCRQINNVKPKVVIGSPETIHVIKKAFNLSNTEVSIITVATENCIVPDDTISFQELVEDRFADHGVIKEVRRKAEDVALLTYSSGTTGLPKAVELTHRNIVANCIQLEIERFKECNDTSDSHQDSIIAFLPFSHIYGIMVLIMSKLSVGAKLVTLPKFQPNLFLTALKEHKVNILYAVPPTILFLGSHPDVKTEHLSSLKKIVCGAAPLHKNDTLKALEKTKPGTQMIQIYGSSETLAVSVGTGHNSYTNVGYALPNTQIKIIDPDHKALGPNEVGELLIRGPQIMKGYRNNPEANRECFTEDGWFKSGDLAFMDKNGVLTIADRQKEIIKVKGYQVPPAELENILKGHPAILDAAVIGIPDQRNGEAPKAFVVLKDGQKAGANDILDFVKERVAAYKKVKEVMFLDSLPKNPSGKLLRQVLKTNYAIN